MKNLWSNLDAISLKLKGNSTKILMLDFDGTLAPIADSPKIAELLPQDRIFLQNLSQKPKFCLAIISGRKLEDIKKKIGLSYIIYAGNHGLQGEILARKYSFPIAKETLLTLENIRKQLDKIAGQFKGVIVEDKNLTVSFHYRLVDKQQAPVIKLLFKEVLRPFIDNGLIYIVAGKEVFDIRPKVDWNKGNFAKLVIKEIARETKTSPIAIFIGDDITDEDVFRTLEDGITIKVGRSLRSSAKYSLKNTKEVFKFLEWIVVNF